MNTLGLLGGMSWESTMTYYQRINHKINQRLGGLHSAQLILHSVDFAPIAKLQHDNQWQATADILLQAALGLQKAQAQGLMICTNTMHKVAPYIAANIDIPIIHIAEATAMRCTQQDIKTVALLGTRFTMEDPFFIDDLTAANIEVLVPNAQQRRRIHDIIYQQLVLGIITDSARDEYIEIIRSLEAQGAEGVILGCTEIGLLIQQKHCDIPVLDTAMIHIDAGVEFALKPLT
jgi:aspartate racemase